MDIKNNNYLKYLKYKKKYLLLKGGDKELNVIIVSHNGRIKCLLTDIGIKLVKDIEIKKSIVKKEMRFKNCSILKLVISSNNISIELFYDGEVDNIKNYYYFTKDDTNIEKKLIKFDKITIDKNNEQYKSILNKLHIKEKELNNFIWNFYLCRHGEGVHNKVKSGFTKLIDNKYKDSELTDDGKKQAINASSSISEINFDLAFVSDLKRTRQTLSLIIENIKKTNFDKINEIYVLPCSHELDFDESGSCDEKQKYTFFENENKMDSDYIKCITDKNLEYCKILNIKLNWVCY